MKNALKEFDVPFSGLKIGKHDFVFEVKQRFFENFDCEEFTDADVQVNIALNKTSTFLELEFEIKGKVFTECFICTENFWLIISAHKKVVVKFGEDFNDDDDELVIIPKNDTSFNVAQIIYEQVVLALPSRRVHPEGECDQEMLKAINKHRATKEPESNPQWDKLKNFYN